jgi:hypothetical protein
MRTETSPEFMVLFDQAKEAIALKQPDEFRDLVKRAPELATSRPPNDATLLHYLTGMPTVDWMEQAPELARLMVEMGSDPNGREKHDRGETPLIWAVSVNNVATAETLLDLGADPELQGRYEQGVDTALGYALFYSGAPNVKTFEENCPEMLVRRGAYIDLARAGGLGDPSRLDEFKTSDATSLSRALFFACLRGPMPMVDRLLQLGADPCLKTPFFWWNPTALHVAALCGARVSYQRFLEIGADPTSKAEPWGDAAGWAQESGSTERMAGLIS